MKKEITINIDYTPYLLKTASAQTYLQFRQICLNSCRFCVNKFCVDKGKAIQFCGGHLVQLKEKKFK